MLVLQRRIGERIVLPDSEVSIVVLGIQGKRVRIGIEAPRSARVHRQEIWEKLVASATNGFRVHLEEAELEIPAT